MKVENRKLHAQNFIAKSHLAASLVNESSIGQKDIVYEIGPGTGRLTAELSRRAKKVIAVEKDRVLYMKLLAKFAYDRNIVLFNADFLRFNIAAAHYKIFANVPFNVTAAVFRKIVHAANPPDEAYLILQKEAAMKLIGVPTTTQASVLVKPMFRLRIIRRFKKKDFSPMPSVDAVLLHLKTRPYPLINQRDMPEYERFVKYGFGAWKKNLKLNYKGVFTNIQWKRLSRDLGFHIHAKPSELRFRQWLGLFEFYRTPRGQACTFALSRRGPPKTHEI